MKVLTESTLPQTLRVIPRSYPTSLTLSLRDDQTNIITTYTLNSGFDVENDYLVITNTYELTENHFYNLTIKDQSANVIYKDKIFCTDQDIDTYSVNVVSLTIDEVESTWDQTEENWEENIEANVYTSDETMDNDNTVTENTDETDYIII